MSNDKFFIVKGSGGLGNRILSALTGILYAHLSGRRLVIDWSDPTYSNDRSNVFPHLFICSSLSSIDEIPQTDSLNPSIWLGHLHETIGEMEKQYGKITRAESRRIFSIDLAKLDYDEDLLFMWSNTQRIDLLRNHFAGKYKELALTSSDAILNKLLREDLILHPVIRKRVDKFKLEKFNNDTVGVHVRYTDRKASLDNIQKNLNRLVKHLPDLQIFLSTDNVEIKNIFEEVYPYVTSTPHWYATSGLRIHGNSHCPDRTESGIEALVDLYLLAECNYLIIDTNSSFSYVAKLLTKAPKSHVFDVRGGRLLMNLWNLSWPIMVKLGLYSRCLSILRKFAIE